MPASFDFGFGVCLWHEILTWLWGQEMASCVQDGWRAGCCDGGLQIEIIEAGFRKVGWLEEYFLVPSQLLALRSDAGDGENARRLARHVMEPAPSLVLVSGLA